MITTIFIFICIGIFIYIRFLSKEAPDYAALHIGAMYPSKIKQDHEYWRFITANFIHIDAMHIFMNMYCIFYLGRFIEAVLGPTLYILFMIFVMIFTSAVVYWSSFYFDKQYFVMTLGASGVFFGYLGALIGLALFLGGGYMTVLTQNMILIGINIAFTLINPGISKAAHFGGLIGGYLFIYISYLIGLIRSL